MESCCSQLPLFRQVLLQPTWTGHGAGGDYQQASLLCAVAHMGRLSGLLGRCGIAINFLGCHRLPERGQLESDADGPIPAQGDRRGEGIVSSMEK